MKGFVSFSRNLMDSHSLERVALCWSEKNLGYPLMLPCFITSSYLFCFYNLLFL